jgi:serine/threonine protein kinase
VITKAGKPAIADEPVTAAAMREVAVAWRSGVTTAGERPCVVKVGYITLQQATAGFSELNEVGSGGTCRVFSGFVFGVSVVIKRLKDGAAEWEARQFATELHALSRLSHPNTARLLAVCIDGPQRCLVLEPYPGALDNRLACRPTSAGQPPPAPLTCQQRVRIARQLASALEHLHALTPPMVHRDIKTPNVLLDELDDAKLCDFGTARDGPGPSEGTHLITALVVGTNGYMPPEYTSQRHVSSKTDIYAFAVVLLELITGKSGRESVALHMEEPELFHEMQAHVDVQAGNWPAPTVQALATIVEQCISFQPQGRPAANEVALRLEALVTGRIHTLMAAQEEVELNVNMEPEDLRALIMDESNFEF